MEILFNFSLYLKVFLVWLAVMAIRYIIMTLFCNKTLREVIIEQNPFDHANMYVSVLMQLAPFLTALLLFVYEVNIYWTLLFSLCSVYATEYVGNFILSLLHK